MDGFEILYRGSLKSCNYRCSYCPFSKHRSSERELMRDREQWMRFVQTIEERAEVLQVGAVMIVPYGEALIHPWYWEGLARLSAISGIRAVGAQTNLSFPVRESLERYQANGGDPGKLRLWGTFHPEMVSIETFTRTCRQILEEGVRMCAGAVGVPENLETLQKLRRKLPEDLYLWINRMDGLKRAYTPEETEIFLKIDPYFLRELICVPSEPKLCRGRLFVEGDGRVRACNISRDSGRNRDQLWEKSEEPESRQALACGRKNCTCYLAYGGRQDFMNQILFGPYPVFRIPRRAKAVFLDIAGTLIKDDDSKKSRTIFGLVRAGLEGLSRDHIPLFFATTLPYEEAKRRCREIWHLFSGGIFSGGAHIVLETEDGRWGQVRELPGQCLKVLEEIRKTLSCQMRIYRAEGKVCKVTMLRPSSVSWEAKDAAWVEERLSVTGVHGVQVFIEKNCLQIVVSEASKAEGVRVICDRLGIALSETVAAGDSAEDEEMLRICGSGVRK